MQIARNDPPTAIIIGGPPGSGKTTIARRLSAAWSVPCLSSDSLGHIIGGSQALKNTSVGVNWIAHDVVFGLCAEFLQAGLSTILDLNLGRAFQWQQLDALKRLYPQARWLPIVLRCPREICLKRISQRYADNPVTAGPPEMYTTTPSIVAVWSFLDQLSRPDVHFVDAARPQDDVYMDVWKYLAQKGVKTSRMGQV